MYNVPKDLTWEHFMHNTYQEGCSECYSENRIIQAKKTVSFNELYPEGRTQNALSKLDFGEHNRNPLE